MVFEHIDVTVVSANLVRQHSYQRGDEMVDRNRDARTPRSVTSSAVSSMVSERS